MTFASLLSLSQQTAAAVFNRNEAGETPRAWFPASASTKAVQLSDYTVYAGEITEGPVKASVAAALGLTLSERSSKAMLVPPLPWIPNKAVTTLIAGFALSGTNNPDPARVKRYRIAEIQTMPGMWEITAEEIAELEPEED